MLNPFSERHSYYIHTSEVQLIYIYKWATYSGKINYLWKGLHQGSYMFWALHSFTSSSFCLLLRKKFIYYTSVYFLGKSLLTLVLKKKLTYFTSVYFWGKSLLFLLLFTSEEEVYLLYLCLLLRFTLLMFIETTSGSNWFEFVKNNEVSEPNHMLLYLKQCLHTVIIYI